MPVREHVLQFYETDNFLLDTVGNFVDTALHGGDSAIVIATRAHRQASEERLRAYSLELAAERARGRYVSLDAAETLKRLIVDGSPDSDRFVEIVGGAVTRAAEGGARRVRIFGEMVALLVAEERQSAALRLEDLWNDLGALHPFSLLCAYPIDRLSGEECASLLEDVCDTHSRVVPAESFTALADADARLRAMAMLQQKASSFERFYQAHSDGHISGLELGRYISRQIIELHGGEIRAEFPPDCGTRFVVRLPVEQGVAAAHRADRADCHSCSALDPESLQRLSAS